MPTPLLIPRASSKRSPSPQSASSSSSFEVRSVTYIGGIVGEHPQTDDATASSSRLGDFASNHRMLPEGPDSSVRSCRPWTASPPTSNWITAPSDPQTKVSPRLLKRKPVPSPELGMRADSNLSMPMGSVSPDNLRRCSRSLSRSRSRSLSRSPSHEPDTVVSPSSFATKIFGKISFPFSPRLGKTVQGEGSDASDSGSIRGRGGSYSLARESDLPAMPSLSSPGSIETGGRDHQITVTNHSSFRSGSRVSVPESPCEMPPVHTLQVANKTSTYSPDPGTGIKAQSGSRTSTSATIGTRHPSPAKSFTAGPASHAISQIVDNRNLTSSSEQENKVNSDDRNFHPYVVGLPDHLGGGVNLEATVLDLVRRFEKLERWCVPRIKGLEHVLLRDQAAGKTHSQSKQLNEIDELIKSMHSQMRDLEFRVLELEKERSHLSAHSRLNTKRLSGDSMHISQQAEQEIPMAPVVSPSARKRYSGALAYSVDSNEALPAEYIPETSCNQGMPFPTDNPRPQLLSHSECPDPGALFSPSLTTTQAPSGPSGLRARAHNYLVQSSPSSTPPASDAYNESRSQSMVPLSLTPQDSHVPSLLGRPRRTRSQTQFEAQLHPSRSGTGVGRLVKMFDSTSY